MKKEYINMDVFDALQKRSFYSLLHSACRPITRILKMQLLT